MLTKQRNRAVPIIVQLTSIAIHLSYKVSLINPVISSVLRMSVMQSRALPYKRAASFSFIPPSRNRRPKRFCRRQTRKRRLSHTEQVVYFCLLTKVSTRKYPN